MLYGLITFLISALAVGVLFQGNAQRFYAAGIFSGAAYLHEFLLSETTGIIYYGSAALFELVIVVLLSGINPLPKMALRLQIISFLFVLTHLFGWVIWFFYFPPFLYDLACAVLFSLALITLILRDKKDVGSFALDCWLSCFRFDRNTLLFHNFKHKGKVS